MHHVPLYPNIYYTNITLEKCLFVLFAVNRLATTSDLT